MKDEGEGVNTPMHTVWDLSLNKVDEVDEGWSLTRLLQGYL